MKILSSVLIVIAASSASAFLPGDDCGVYAPSTVGTETELKQFSANGKPEGTSKTKVIAVNKTANGSSVELKSEAFDKKDKLIGSSNYVVTCENGNFLVDMRTMIPSGQTEAYKDMQMTVEADKLDIPANPSPGQELKNGAVNMTFSQEGSPMKFKIAMTVTNRKVTAIEDVTVPAGSFKCVKITYDAEMKNVFTIRMKMAEWYAKNVGLVRSESYNSKEKLESYMVLNAIKK